MGIEVESGMWREALQKWRDESEIKKYPQYFLLINVNIVE